jgi:BirA family biotin operon repressor/biotin-[acetyl-CoA-carboxylase] ligase
MTPFDVARFHALLKTKTFGRNFIFEPSVGSTMDLARDAARHGEPEGAVAAADEQTAGRGRLGRAWITPPAVNLATTLILRPPHSVLRDVAMIAPLAVVHAVEDVCGLRPEIKWPNDVVVRGQGTEDSGQPWKKLAGILIESDLTDERHPLVLVGAGINVNFDARDYTEIRDIATSLRTELGREVDREALLAAYLLRFEELYGAAKAGESPLERWKQRLVTLGRRVHASWPGGEADGLAEDVDEDGALLVRTDAALVRVEAGDVTLRA